MYFSNLVPPNISVAAVVEIYPRSKVDISVTGTVPMNTSIIRNTSELVLTSNSVSINFHPFEEGNYTCVATSKYGSDSREFSVIFKGMTKLFYSPITFMDHSEWCQNNYDIPLVFWIWKLQPQKRQGLMFCRVFGLSWVTESIWLYLY